MAKLPPHYIDVDLKKNTQYNVPVVTQNDTATHFIIRVTDDGLTDPELLDAYQEITMTSQRPDGESFYLTGTRIPGTNEIKFHLGTDETAFHGSVLASLQFYLVEDASRYTSAQFRYDVKKDLTKNYTPTQREETLVEVVLRDGPVAIQEAKDAKIAVDGALVELEQDKTAAIGRLDEVTEENKTIFREPVATFAALSTTYPNPEHGTTVRVTGESATYRYSDGDWVKTDEYNPTAIDQVTAQLAETPKRGEIAVYDIDKNKGKFDQSYMSDDFLQQMAGTTPINAVPADRSLTTEKFANDSVDYYKIKGAKPTTNLFDKNTMVGGFSISHTSGELYARGSFSTSDFIPVTEGTYIISIVNIITYYDENKNFVSGVNLTEIPTNYIFTVPAGVHYIRFAYSTTTMNTMMVVKGDAMPAEYVPFSRRVDWLKVDAEGVSLESGTFVSKTVGGALTEMKTEINSLSQVDAKNTGVTPEDYGGDVYAALASGYKLIIPQGQVYTLNKPLNLSSGSVVEINGRLQMANSVNQNLMSNVAIDSNTVTVQDGTAFKVGQWVGITDDNRPIQGGSGGLYARDRYGGECGRVIAINGNILTLEGTFKWGYTVVANAKVGTMNNAIIADGVENISIYGTGVIDGNKDNQFNINASSMVSGRIEEIRAGCGISATQSKNVQIHSGLTIQNFILHNIVLGNNGFFDEGIVTTNSKIEGIRSLGAYDKNILMMGTRDCNIIGNDCSDSTHEDGISLHVFNKNFKILNNNCKNNPRFGIYMRDESDGGLVDGNFCDNNWVNYQIETHNIKGGDNTSIGGQSGFAVLIRGNDCAFENFDVLKIGDRNGMNISGSNNKIRGGTFEGCTGIKFAMTIGTSGGILPKAIEVSGATIKNNNRGLKIYDGDIIRVVDNILVDNVEYGMSPNTGTATNLVINRNHGVADRTA